MDEEKEVEVPAIEEDGTEEWQNDLSLPGEGDLIRDWSRPRRNTAYMHPDIILPGWRRRR